jgi:hypothetical protein
VIPDFLVGESQAHAKPIKHVSRGNGLLVSKSSKMLSQLPGENFNCVLTATKFSDLLLQASNRIDKTMVYCYLMIQEQPTDPHDDSFEEAQSGPSADRKA